MTQKQKKPTGIPSQGARVEAAPMPIQGPPWLGWAFAGLSAVVFYLTTCRTIPGGDSGELVSVAFNLGVAHPPGYPLYTLMAHLATYWPFGSVAWRVNLLSGVFAVASGLMIFSLVARWQRDRWLAVMAAAIFIFSPLAWRYAVVAEVFTLNNLFIVSLLYATLRFVETPNLQWAVVWAGTLGLACSHHHTILFLAVPIFLFLIWTEYKFLLKPRVIFLCALVFVLGLLPYIYIPFAAQKNLLISWGRADTWEGFWTHFLRREYGTFKLAVGETDYMNMFSSLKFYAMDMGFQMLFVGLPVAAFGLWQAWRGRLRQDRFARILLWSFLFYVIGFHALANMDLSNRLFYDVQSRFWLLPNMILALFMAAGCKILLDRWPQFAGRARWAIVALTLGLQIGLHYSQENHSKNRIFYDLGKGLLDGLPPGALVFQRGDVYVNSVRYQQSVEHYRTDVISIPFDLLWWPWMRGVIESLYPNIRFPGKLYRYSRVNLGDYTLRDFFDLNFERFPCFIGKMAEYEIKNLSEKFQIVPVGFLNRIYRSGSPFDFNSFAEDSERFNGFKPPQKDEIREKSWEAFIYYNYWDRELEKSKFLFIEATKLTEARPLISYSAKILERVIWDYPEAPPGAWRNLGVAYQMMTKSDPKYYPMMVSVWKTYLATNPKDDVQLPNIKLAIQTAAGISTPAPPVEQSK